MPKPPLTLKIRIPEFKGPRTNWRRAIHEAVLKERRKRKIKFKPSDRIEVTLSIYFNNERSAQIHDIDNRLKDCMDALQGRVGGTKTKKTRALKPIIPNDHQIWRAVVEKALAPKQALDRKSGTNKGHLTIRKFTKH